MVVATRPHTSNIHRRFSPHDLGNLELWFAADHISASDDDAIATWTDSSGNGRDAAQATGANKPTFKTNIVNGLPVLRFDGTADYMTISDFAFSSSATPAGLSVFVVAKYDAAPPAAYEPMIAHFDTNSQRSWSFGAITPTGRLRAKVSADGGNSNFKNYRLGQQAPNSADFFIGSMIYGGGALSGYTNGVLENPTKTTDDTVGTLHNSTADLTIGAELASGSVVADSYIDGDIAEIIAYDQKLDDGERSRVERYLSNKYGINVFNPADIPDIKRWYSAGAIDGVTDGQNVPTWDDWHLEAASTDDDAVQGTSSLQPTLELGEQNGHPGVRFDGGDDQLLNTTGPNVSAITIACVAHVTITPANQIVAAEWAGDHRKFGIGLIAGASPGRPYLAISPDGSNDNVVYSTDGTVRSTVVLLVATHPGETGNQVLRTNTAQVDSDSVSDMFTSGTSDFRIGALAGAYEFADDIFEIIIIDRVLNSKEIDALEGYLNDKYEVV